MSKKQVNTIPLKDTIKDHLQFYPKNEQYFISIEYPKLIGRDKNKGIVLDKYPMFNWPLKPSPDDLDRITLEVITAISELNQDEGYNLVFV